MIEDKKQDLPEESQQEQLQQQQPPQSNVSIIANKEKMQKIIAITIVVLSIIALYILFFTGDNNTKQAQDPIGPRTTVTEQLSQPDFDDIATITSNNNNKQLDTNTTNSENKDNRDPQSKEGETDKESSKEKKKVKKKPKKLSAPHAPTPPPPPPPKLAAKKSSLPKPADARAYQEDLARHRQHSLDLRGSNIMVFGGGGSNNSENDNDDSNSDNSNGNNQGKGKKKSSQYLGFDEGIIEDQTLEESDADSNIATIISDMTRTLAQGKVIYAIMETAINTELEGSVRAIVSRDIYAESGKNILIRKGSRLVGTYDTSVSGGQTRVDVTWDRVITPSGIDVKMESKGTDSLGRSGIVGKVDPKIKEKLMNAFLTSYLIPYATMVATNTGNDKMEFLQGYDGNPLLGGTTRSLLMQNANKEFSNIARDAINDSISTKISIAVPQGTPVNVIVMKDLIFPKEAISTIKLHH